MFVSDKVNTGIRFIKDELTRAGAGKRTIKK